MAKDQKLHEELDAWTERDLGEAAAAGELAPAFEQDQAVARLDRILIAGRSPVLTGDRGVGKTVLPPISATSTSPGPSTSSRTSRPWPSGSTTRCSAKACARGSSRCSSTTRTSSSNTSSTTSRSPAWSDEFEKASAKVHDRFLQLFDEGSFINGAGESISCRSFIIIATSNAGAELWRGGLMGFAGSGDPETLNRALDRRLHEIFRFEFLNRFDRVVHFRPLDRRAIRTIASRELEQLKRRTGLEQRRLALEVDAGLLDWLTVHGYDPHHGARFLRRTIEREVTTALASLLVRGNPPPGARVELLVRRGHVGAPAASTSRSRRSPSWRSPTAAR